MKKTFKTVTIFLLVGMFVVPTMGFVQNTTIIKQGAALSANQSSIDAIERSGCCSHHGGVCGCDGNTGHQQCCDGDDSPSCLCGE